MGKTEPQDRLARAYTRLTSLRKNLPPNRGVPELYVQEYHSILDILEEDGFQLSEFRVSMELARPHVASHNVLTGLTKYTSTRYVEYVFFVSKFDALLSYFQFASQPSEERPRIGFSAPKAG